MLLDSGNIKGIVASLIRKNGLTGSIDNETIELGRDGTDLFLEDDTVVEGPITGVSTLFMSGTTILQGAATTLASFNVSGITTLQGAATTLASFNVSGVTTLQGATTTLSSFNVSGVTTLQGAATTLSSFNVSGVTTINNTLNAMEVKQQYQASPIAFALLVPTGSIMSFAGASAPAGWLLCDGTAYNGSIGTLYNALWSIIGTTYGGAGIASFQVPNIKGRVIVGFNTAETEFNSLGETGGEKEHTLTIAEMPSHSHTIITDDGGSSSSTIGQSTGDDTLSTANGSTEANGGGQPHNNLQPYIVLNYIIKY